MVFRILCGILILLALAFVIANRNAPTLETQNSPAIGKPAPQVDLVLLSDGPDLTRVDSTPGDTVTLLHCWGTWCGPCQMEYPELSEMTNELEKTYPLRFEFVSVSCERGPDATFESLWIATRDFFDRARVQSKAYADPSGITRRSIAERLERDRLYYPTSILIDRKGDIAGAWEGFAPESVSEMESLALQLLATDQ